MWQITEEVRARLVVALQRLEFLADEMGSELPDYEGREKALELSREALALVQEITLPPQQRPIPGATLASPGLDPRILRQVGKLRLVAPARKQSGSAQYLNGQLLIEHRETDALGAERWMQETEIRWGGGVSRIGRAVFRLLAGDGWDDRELREYDK